VVLIAQNSYAAGTVLNLDSVARSRDDEVGGGIADGDDAVAGADFEFCGLELVVL